MFKKLFVAAVAAMATFVPVGAEVQPGTSSLLETISSNGILVTINHEDCAGSGTNGSYRWLGFQREMRLCPGNTVDAVDHNTVRHETIHAIQHCVNTMRQTPANTPVNNDLDQLVDYINEGLSEETVSFIKRSYPREHWWIEFEANLAEDLTAVQIEEVFREACMAQ